MEGKSSEVEKSTIFASRTSSLNSIKYFFRQIWVSTEKLEATQSVYFDSQN